jgi:hypothetical protein
MFVTLMLIFEISQALFLISCFSLKISCETENNFLAACCHAGGLCHALVRTPVDSAILAKFSVKLAY